MLATALITVIASMGVGVTEPGPVPVVMAQTSGMTGLSRGGSPIPVPVVSSVVGWCAWWWYLVWTAHCYMSVIITIIAAYVWAIASHMANLLALETPVVIAGHCVDQ